MSDNLLITQMVDGQNTPEVTHNEANGDIDSSMTEFYLMDMSAANVTLTDAQFARYILFRTSGNTVARSMLFTSPSKRLFAVDNTGTAILTITMGTTDVLLLAGGKTICYTDGTANGLVEVGTPQTLNNSTTTDPVVGSDNTLGYSINSIWINTTSSEVFRAIDVSTGAAVWVKTTLTIDELGDIVTQNANAIAITGGTIAGITTFDLANGGALRTTTTDTHTALIQAYDVDGTAYVTFGTLTAGNVPTFDLDASVTVGGSPIVGTGSLGTIASQDASAVAITGGTLAGITTLDLANGGALRTTTADTETLLIQAYDVDGTAYTTFGTLTAGNVPTFDLSTAVTVGGNAIIYSGLTDSVTLDMLVDVNTNTFLGRTTAATGTVEELTTGQAKAMLNLTGTNSGDETLSSINALNITSVGTLTSGDVTAAIGSGTITIAMMADIATDTFLGRVTAATGVVEVLTNAQAKTALDLTGTNSGDQTTWSGFSDTLANLNTAVSDATLVATGTAVTLTSTTTDTRINGAGTKTDGLSESDSAEVQTTDATVTTLLTVALEDENTYYLEATVCGVQSTGGGRTSTKIAGTFYRTAAGSATQQGTTTVVHGATSFGSGGVAFTVSGNNVLVEVTGVAATTIEWGGSSSSFNMSN